MLLGFEDELFVILIKFELVEFDGGDFLLGVFFLLEVGGVVVIFEFGC